MLLYPLTDIGTSASGCWNITGRALQHRPIAFLHTSQTHSQKEIAANGGESLGLAALQFDAPHLDGFIEENRCRLAELFFGLGCKEQTTAATCAASVHLRMTLQIIF